MPTIAVASPKGGSGKSTVSVLLGTEMARAGGKVTFLDCDPNRSISIWARLKDKLPARIAVRNDIDENNIVSRIRELDRGGRIIIADLEGIASRLVSRAISQADLVLIPMRATALDANIGMQTAGLIAKQERVLARRIRYAVVLTMTRAILSQQHRKTERRLKQQGIAVIRPSLMERAAFAALFDLGGDLQAMPAQGRMDKAIANARGFAMAVYNHLLTQRQENADEPARRPRIQGQQRPISRGQIPDPGSQHPTAQ